MDVVDRSALVHYSNDEMFELVSDIDAYSQFLPWCGGARVLSRGQDEMVASIDFSVSGVCKSFTTRNRLKPGREISMQLVEGPFSQLEGRWRFEPLGDAGRVKRSVWSEGETVCCWASSVGCG